MTQTITTNTATASPQAASAGSRQARRRDAVEGHFDRWLLLVVVALACLGVVMVTSSSIAVADNKNLGAFYFLRRHLLFLCMGGVALVAMTRIELRRIEKGYVLLLLAAFALLGAVFLPGIGVRTNGAQRWLDLGVSTFQPVEFAKVALIVYVASYLVRHREGVEQRLFGTINPLLVALLFCLALLAQPDFGSAALIVAVSVGMIWLGGARVRYLSLIGLGLAAAGAALVVTASYRLERITSFLDPWQHRYTDGFQLTQSLIAIGRGGWFGVGLGDSVQKLAYLPEAHTDFILAIIAEELGLVGVLFVLGLYILLVIRGLSLGVRGVQAGQPFAAYVAFGISLSIGLQALVCIGVNLGALPTKGLTLPLISSGGSSVVMTCLLLGLLLRAGYEITRAEAQRERNMARQKAGPKASPTEPAEAAA